MIFYFNSNGAPIGSIVERVFCGSVNATGTYFVCPIAKTLTVSVAFSTPDGKTTAKLPMVCLDENEGISLTEDGTTFNVWKIDTPVIVTQNSGSVTVQFFVSSADGVVFSTARCVFTVEEGVIPSQLEDNANYDEIATVISGLNAILSGLSEAATKDYVDNAIKDAYGSIGYSTAVNGVPLVLLEGMETYFQMEVNSIFFNPQPASSLGKHFYLMFKSGETPTTINFGTSGYYICDELVPLANHIVEISGIWNGEKWVVASRQTAVN